jgi:endonuclease-8
VPEGDTLHRLAARLAPVLIGRVVRVFELPRRTDDVGGLVGASIVGVEARGKNLLVHFDRDRTLHVHLAMRGRVELGAIGRRGREAVAIIETDAHAVIVRSAPVARLLRTRDLVRDRAFRDLGPDLLGPSFDVDEALRRIRARDERPLGEVLLDQGAVAGIGNVWKSELCFLTKLDPFALTACVTDDELRALLARGRELMREAVDAPRRRWPDPFTPRASRVTRDPRRGESALCVYDRATQPCYTCGTPIVSASQGNVTPRITYACPTCQPRR